jgi:hypothetical protein
VYSWMFSGCVLQLDRYKCTGVGDNVCFTTVREMSIEVVVYNLSTGSWTRLPSCTWRNNYWMDGMRNVKFFTKVMKFQPRLDIHIEE